MNQLRRKKLISVVLPALALFLGVTFSGDDDIYQKIGRNMDLFGQVYREIALNYVDDIDADKFMEAGIEGMLSTLDPYTSYIDEDSRDQIDLITTGKYGGIGITVGVRDSQFVVTDIMNGYEAQKKGLRIGDVILEIDGKDLSNEKIDKMRGLVRGAVGSNLGLKVIRDGEILDFQLTRQEIILKNVSYFGYIEPKSNGIAYIRLDRFTNISESEIENAIKTLKSEGEMKALVLDLRDNGGGLLDAATGILDKIVPKNSLLVITKGKRADSEKKYFSEKDPMIGTEIPVAVLINNRTASASEIVAGAVQDLDRGVVVGTKSFGKGLVQQIKDLDKKSQLKITGSRYFTPSGRWIQEKNYFKENKYGVFIDKEKYSQSEFRTLGGRTVKALGGITPDVEVDVTGESEIHSALLSKDMFFKFATKYVAENPGAGIAEPNDQLFENFKAFLTQSGFEYASKIEKKLSEIKELAGSKSFGDDFGNSLDKLKLEADNAEGEELNAAKEEILMSIFNEINKLRENEVEQIQATFPYDKQLQRAIELVTNPSEYNTILGK